MWTDNETTEDFLGFKVHADLLVDVIRDDTILPVTIGVFGDWGSGKSSILKIMYEELTDSKPEDLKDDTLVLYFNGWVFEGYDDAKAALLDSIVSAFEQHKTLKGKVKKQAAKLLKSVKWMRAVGLGFKKVVIPSAAAYLTGGLSLIPFLAQELSNIKPEELSSAISSGKAENLLKGLVKEKEEDQITLVREFREDFKEMIDASNIRKLVVIIDDLDRCTSDRIIENLEAIKLFLNVEKTAFVIGADPRIVRHAIEYRYKTDRIENADDPDSRNKRIVSDYLEKLIQIPYNLPKLSDREVETYMTLLFCKKELDTSFAKVIEAFIAHREKDRYSVFGFGDIQPMLSSAEQIKLGDSIGLIASLSSIITEGLNGNPRQIKRFLNTFTLRKRLVQIANISGFKVDILAKLMVLEYSSPELFRKLYEWQLLQDGEPKEMMELEKLADEGDKDALKERYAEWTSEKIVRWLKVEPKLTEIDLRDYYWISRDQLSRSISGSSLIPTHIRSLTAKLINHPSGTILERTIKTEIMGALTENDADSLFILLEKELSKAPDNDKIHKVYIELMSQKHTNSIKSYSRIIQQLDHDKVPFSLRHDFQTALQKNSDIDRVIKLFKLESQIGKGLAKPKK